MSNTATYITEAGKKATGTVADGGMSVYTPHCGWLTKLRRAFIR